LDRTLRVQAVCQISTAKFEICMVAALSRLWSPRRQG